MELISKHTYTMLPEMAFAKKTIYQTGIYQCQKQIVE